MIVDFGIYMLLKPCPFTRACKKNKPFTSLQVIVFASEYLFKIKKTGIQTYFQTVGGVCPTIN